MHIRVADHRIVLYVLLGTYAFAVMGLVGCASLENRIVFDTIRHGDAEIYSMDTDGGRQARLTQDPADDFHPSWSPDRKSIAFVSTREGDFDIYVMDADGGNPNCLTSSLPYADYPAWSPDGKLIAFSSGSGYEDIWVMNANGTGETNITNTPNVNEIQPTWSPDGKKIAFAVSGAGPNQGIYVIDHAGATPATLILPNGYDPAWSPDGARIAYSLNVGSAGIADVHVADSDGGNPQNLTNWKGIDAQPCWSPDGSKILFVRCELNSCNVYVMSNDGTNPKNISSNPPNPLPVSGFQRGKGNPDWK